jgi:hypothetical protein
MAGIPWKDPQPRTIAGAAESIREALEILVDTPCTFWACKGPDAGRVPMQTCSVCATVITLREGLAKLGVG